MASRFSKLHDVRPKENLDRFIFIMAFVLGIAGGVVLKLNGAHPFIAAGYSAAILILYAVATWVGGRLQIEPETIGDNCYYLGFLFTLTSLALTLYQIADPTTNGEKTIAIPEVISGFGVALSSTIFGVFLRVLLMQIRLDFVAKEKAVRAELNRSYAGFQKDLLGIRSQMKAFSTESMQSAAERDKRLRNITEKFVTDHQESLQKAADTLAKNMENSFSQASQKAVNDIAESIRKTNKETHTALLELVSGIRKLKDELNAQESQALEDIVTRRALLNAEVESVRETNKETQTVLLKSVSDIKTLKDRLNEQESQAHKDIVTHRTRLNAELEAARKTNKGTQTALLKSVSDIQTLKDRLSKRESQALEDIVNRRACLNTELETAEKLMKAHNLAIGDYIKTKRRSTDAMTKGVIPAMDAFKKRLDELPKDGLVELGPATTGHKGNGFYKSLMSRFRSRIWPRRSRGSDD